MRRRGLPGDTESYRRRAPAAKSQKKKEKKKSAARRASARFVLPRPRRIPRSVAAAAARGRRAATSGCGGGFMLASSRHRPRRTPALASSRRTSVLGGSVRGGSGRTAAAAVFLLDEVPSRGRRALRAAFVCSKSGRAGVTLDPGQLPTRARSTSKAVGAGDCAESSKTSSRTSAGAAWGVGGDLAVSASAGGVGGGCTPLACLSGSPLVTGAAAGALPGREASSHVV